MDNKKWFHSRTLWINALSLIGVALLEFTGFNPLNTEFTASVLVIVNMVLRAVTKTGLST